jgi:hypothetical protein
MAAVLEEEVRTYEAHRDALLGTAKGKYVLIKGDRIIDCFTSREDALKRGYDEFGNAPFLVKEIVETEVPLHFTSFHIAV